MLPTSFINRFSQIMDIKLSDLSTEARSRFSQRSAEMSRRGFSTPPVTPMLHHESAVWLTLGRIEAALDAIKRLISSGHALPYSEKLSVELKQLVESFATETWCKQSVDAYGPLTTDKRIEYDKDLLLQRSTALDKANLEIDLLADAARSNTAQVLPQSKEFDQKFKILLSAGQARLDFEAWMTELKPTGGSIAILFIDIDHFKTFNTKYTETVVDETLLPNAMALIQNLASQRGGAYKQGGEEFLVILPNHDRTEASAFAEKLRTAFERNLFLVEDNEERMTVSVGIALFPEHGQTYDQVLKIANKAKATAKLTRNTCVTTN